MFPELSLLALPEIFQTSALIVGEAVFISLSSLHGACSGCNWRTSLPMWRVAVNVLNEQSRTADKEWCSSMGVGRRAKYSSPQRTRMLQIITQGHCLGELS
jgi:hypothetical protein